MNDNSFKGDSAALPQAELLSAQVATPEFSPAEVSAAVVVDELLRLGMKDAVVCPGSRSAPLARALFLASQEHKVRLHVRIDERAAAFLALGLAAATGVVTPIVTTSGTAVANLLPAMVEAHASSLPLLALTADRPAHYRGTGANQTIVQHRLFADASVAEFDLDGTQEVTAAVAGHIRARVDRIVAAMAQGPAHLNIRFVEPLVPQQERPVVIPEGREQSRPWTRIAAGRGRGAGQAAGEPLSIDISRRTLVIAGSGAVHIPALEELPTIAEPNAYAPAVPVHPLAAATFEQIPPEQILVVGRPTLHRGVARLLARNDIEVTIVSEAALDGAGVRYPDVSATAQAVVHPGALRVKGQQEEQWLSVCDAASQLAVTAVRESIAESSSQLTGLHVAAAVADSIRTGEQLVLGASNSVRDASWVGLPFPGVDCYAGRGAAGIDGTIATAIGLALARDRAHADEFRPPRTIALMGDLTFQHDAGALAIGPGEPRPENLTIVVANDSGGGIFETLEAGAPALRASFERIFATAQDVDVQALSQAYGVDYVFVDNLTDLLAQLHPDTDVDGIRVIEVATDRHSRRSLHAKLTYNAQLDL